MVTPFYRNRKEHTQPFCINCDSNIIKEFVLEKACGYSPEKSDDFGVDYGG